MSFVRRIGVLLVVLACSGRPVPALACGGLFCNGNQVTVPPAQSAERLLFVLNPPGWSEPPEALSGAWSPASSEPGPKPEPEAPPGRWAPLTLAPGVGPQAGPGPTLDAYIEVAYSGAAGSFAWVVPVDGAPLLVGTARREVFELDAASAPRFSFVGPTPVPGPMSSVTQGDFYASGGGGCFAGRGVATQTDPGGQVRQTFPARNLPIAAPVAVVRQSSVGPYEVAVLRAHDSQALHSWLVDHQYDVPPAAVALLEPYVREGKTFVAFRLSDGEGTGAIEPVVLRLPGSQPCIPLRLTPVASDPLLTVTALVLGDGRARVQGFSDTAVDLQSVRPISPTTLDYSDRLRQAVDAAGGRAFVTELAGPTDLLMPGVSPALSALLRRSRFLTRLSTAVVREAMTVDPVFTVSGADLEGVDNLTLIDISDDPVALERLGLTPATAAAPVSPAAPVAAALTLLWRRRRRYPG
jgi:hypothetical protein